MFVRFAVYTEDSSTGFLAKIHYGNEILNQKLVQRGNKVTVSINAQMWKQISTSIVSPKIQFGHIFCPICQLSKKAYLLLPVIPMILYNSM